MNHHLTVKLKENTMKRSIILLVVILISIPAWNQELSKKEQKKLVKELKKEQKAEEEARKAEIIKIMVEHGRFVLEADQLRGKGGTIINVSSPINFIACDSVRGVIQIGNEGYVGINGVGGITIEGPISNYKVVRNSKNGSYRVSYNVLSSSGTYDVSMSVFGEGKADAVISSNWPGRLNYLGYLIPPSLSKVYKGTSF
jgi:hypothetical protein